MSPEDPVHDALTNLGTESPSETFLAELRNRLKREMSHLHTSTNNEVAMISATDTNNRAAAVDQPRSPRQRLALVALVATVVAVVAVGALWNRDSNNTSTDQSPTSTPSSAVEPSTTTTEPTTTTEETTSTPLSLETLAVGEAWVDSIVSNDRAEFVSLHAPDVITNDTLMAWTGLVPGGMTRETLSSLYFDGFDAFQASIETDNDFVDVDGCEVAGSRDQIARCSYRASLIGGDETFTVRADLTVEDGLITNVFLATGNEPPGLVSRMPGYLGEFGTDQDNACRQIGFNSVECGQHESDLLTRYLSFLEDAEGS